MSKISIKTKKRICILICFSIIYVGLCTVLYNRTDEKWHEAATQSLIISDNLFCTDGTCPAETMTRMKNFVDALPESIKTSLIKGGWSICVCNDEKFNVINRDSNVKKSYYEDDGVENITIGMTIVSPKLVYVDTSEHPDIIYEAFVHEMGHVISYICGAAHGSIKFASYYNKYKDDEMFSLHERASTSEFFAGAFRMYYVDNLTLSLDYPELDEYINEVLQSDVCESSKFSQKAYVSTVGTLRTIWFNITRVLSFD